MSGGPSDTDSYIAAIADPARRAALAQLRAIIRARLPDHVECISYAMPGFRQPGRKGRMVAGYAAFARHLGLYPHSGSVIPKLAAECAGFQTSKSGVLFTPENPLPKALVLKIIELRLAELGAS